MIEYTMPTNVNIKEWRVLRDCHATLTYLMQASLDYCKWKNSRHLSDVGKQHKCSILQLVVVNLKDPKEFPSLSVQLQSASSKSAFSLYTSFS